MITDVHIALELAERSGPVKLAEWRQGRELHDTVEVYVDGRYETVDIEPDAFFRLKMEHPAKDGKFANRAFFLETDRSTMPKIPREGSRRFHDKFRKYRLYIHSGRLKENYGVEKSIRIVTVTKTPGRRDNLTEDGVKLIPEGSRKYFLFGWIDDFPLTTRSRSSTRFFSAQGADKSVALMEGQNLI